MGNYVYFAITRADREYIKIGKTSCEPRKRLAGIRTGSPNEIYMIAAFSAENDTERKLHHLFKEYRHHLEWFRFDGRVREFSNIIVEDAMYEFVDCWQDRMHDVLIERAETLFNCVALERNYEDYFEYQPAQEWFDARKERVLRFGDQIRGDFTFNQFRWMASHYDKGQDVPWVCGRRVMSLAEIWLDWSGKERLSDEKLAESILYARKLPWEEHSSKQKVVWAT